MALGYKLLAEVLQFLFSLISLPILQYPLLPTICFLTMMSFSLVLWTTEFIEGNLHDQASGIINWNFVDLCMGTQPMTQNVLIANSFSGRGRVPWAPPPSKTDYWWGWSCAGLVPLLRADGSLLLQWMSHAPKMEFSSPFPHLLGLTVFLFPVFYDVHWVLEAII